MPVDSTPSNAAGATPVRPASSKSSPIKVKAAAASTITGPIKLPGGAAKGETSTSSQKQKFLKVKPLQSTTAGASPSITNRPTAPDIKSKGFKPLNPSVPETAEGTQLADGPQDAPGPSVKPSKGVTPSVPEIARPGRRQTPPEPIVKGGGRRSATEGVTGTKSAPSTSPVAALADLIQREGRKSDALPEMQPSFPDKGVDTWAAFWTPDLDAVNDTPSGAAPSFR